jgi:hypothetical protein
MVGPDTDVRATAWSKTMDDELRKALGVLGSPFPELDFCREAGIGRTDWHAFLHGMATAHVRARIAITRREIIARAAARIARRRQMEEMEAAEVRRKQMEKRAPRHRSTFPGPF